MPSKLDPHLALIEGWLAAEPWLTAIAIVGRLAELHPDQFGNKQHPIVQRLLRALRKSTARDFSLRRQLREYENVAHPPGLWTARAMQGPTRPQPLFLYQSSILIHQPMSYGRPPGNILR